MMQEDIKLIDIVIELIGGIEPARTYILSALNAGKHVVSANKDLIAVHGKELLDAAEAHHVDFLFEAAVAGGIPKNVWPAIIWLKSWESSMEPQTLFLLR